MARKKKITPAAQDPDDVPPEYYIESLFPRGTVEEALKQGGYTNVQVAPDAIAGLDCFTVNMRRENGAVDAAGIRQQLDQIVGQIPQTDKYRITWRVLQSVAIVQGDRAAAAVRVKRLLGKKRR